MSFRETLYLISICILFTGCSAPTTEEVAERPQQTIASTTTEKTTTSPTVSSSPTLSKTPEPIFTSTLEPTLTSTPTVTPCPTPTLDAVAVAPEIEGLRIVEKDGRVVYLAERGNHYRLEADAYAGELVEYTLNRQQEWGVGLVPPVLEVLLEGKQDFEFSMEKSQQDIASDERKFPLPFDPRGLKFEAGEVKYTREVTMADGSPFEMKRCFLGLNLPKGTTIYNPIGADSKDSPMTAYYAKHGVIFSSEERKERLAEKCLQEGFCLTTTSRVSEEETREVVREYPKTLDLQREDKRMLPFSIYLPWDSSGDQNVFAEIEKGNIGPREIAPLGDPLFVVDSREPAVQFAFASDYPIMFEASQAETKFENLFQIDNQYVFVLPSP